jgi:cytochrome c5
MGKYSDDEAVEGAVLAAEADYVAAQDAVRAAPDDPDVKAAYEAAKTAFHNARVASREGRTGMGIVAEGN